MKTKLLLIIALFSAISLVAQDQSTDTPTPADTESTSSGWTPFRYSFLNIFAWPKEDIPVYGIELDLIQGDNNYTAGYCLGFFSCTKNFKGLSTGFVHKAEKSQGFIIAGTTSADISHGFDIGGINFCQQYQAGVQTAAMFNYTEEGQDGIRIAGLANVSKSGYQDGIQLAGFMNQAKSFQGVQLAGIVNLEDDMGGLQLGTVNVIGFKHRKLSRSSSGCQTGVVNYISKPKAAKTVEQESRDWIVQFGLINYKQGASGIQFGLININKNGFLPFFPLINFNL